MPRQESLLQWPLLARSVPAPADCVCHWADWRWSPLHGSSERGLHHPVCPGDPPFATGRARGIAERRVGGEGDGRRRRTEQLSLSILGQKLKTLIAWCGLKKKMHPKQKITVAVQMQGPVSHFSLSWKKSTDST